MKVLRTIMIALSATLALGSCSDDNDPNNDNGNVSISLSTDIIQKDNHGGEATVKVTSPGDWRLSGVAEWVHPSAVSGKNGDEVTFTIDANSMDEKRTVVFKFFCGSQVAPITIESVPGYSVKLVGEPERVVAQNGGSLGIQMEGNIAQFEVSSNEEWLTYDNVVSFMGKQTINCTVQPNDTYKDRTATLTIASELTSEPIVLSITQSKTEFFSVTPDDAQKFDMAERNVTFTVKSNIEFEASVESGKEWIADPQISHSVMGEDGLSVSTVSFHLSALTSGIRSGSVCISSSLDRKDISIMQKDPNMKTFSIPDEDLAEHCVEQGWVVSAGNSEYMILEAGQTATELSMGRYNRVGDLTGIENFPNLKYISFRCSYDAERIDISGLHKVETLKLSGNSDVEFYNFGDNPISTLEVFDTGTSLDVKNLTIISTKLESLDLSLESEWEQEYDSVVSIDLSGCPALKTLKVDRGSKLKTLYLKQGQTIENLTKNDATEIVYK